MRALIENTTAFQRLKTQREKKNLSHAYLLVFDDAKHLSTALKECAKIFFYAEGDAEDLVDENLKRIAALIDGNKYPDCLTYPKNEKRLTAEEAEEIVEECFVRPVEGEKKIFLIDKFDEALPAAQNKLLKVLEEPHEGVFFVLGARTVYPVLSTVQSRTQKLEILPFSVEEVGACIERNYYGRFSKEEISLVSALSCGSVGAAESYLLTGFYKAVVEDAFALCLTEISHLPALVKKVGETKNKKELLTLIRLIYRDALVLKTAKSKRGEFLLLAPERARVYEVAKKYTLRALLIAQEKLTEAEKQLKFNTNFAQCIEICMASILQEI